MFLLRKINIWNYIHKLFLLKELNHSVNPVELNESLHVKWMRIEKFGKLCPTALC